MIVGMVKPTRAARRRRQASPTPITTGWTLARLERETDALIGAPSHLSEHLAAYRHGRDVVAAIRAAERTAAKQAACQAAVSRGAVSDGRWRLVSVGERQRLTLTSEAVRRGQPTLWADSRPVAWSLSVTPGDVWAPPRLAPIRAGTVGQLIASVRHDTETATRAAVVADGARAALIGVYEAIDAVMPWGGDQLATADGWVIGYRATPTFNAAVCRLLAADRGVDVTPLLSLVTIGPCWRVVPADDDQGDGDQYAP